MNTLKAERLAVPSFLKILVKPIAKRWENMLDVVWTKEFKVDDAEKIDNGRHGSTFDAEADDESQVKAFLAELNLGQNSFLQSDRIAFKPG